MEWFVFFLVFSILFLGELGDKTQLIVFNLSLEYEKPYKIAIGATLGFAVIVTIGVFLGIVITRIIPISIIAIVSGIVFIIMGILETSGLRKLYTKRKQNIAYSEIKNDDFNKEKMNGDETSLFSKLKKNPYFAGFWFIFLMELGDKTQILTITLASIYPFPFEVWLGSFLALITLAWIGAFFGASIARKVPKFHLKLASSLIFIFIGVLIIITSI